jgi:hypothetical protein
MTTLNLQAGTTTTISSGVTTYSSVTVGALSVLDVTGTGTDVTLDNIGVGVASTFEVSSGAILDLNSFVGLDALTSLDIGNTGTMELGSGLNISLLEPVAFQNTAGTAAVFDVDSGVNVSLLSYFTGWKNGDTIQLSGQTISGVSYGPSAFPGYGDLTVSLSGGGTESLTFENSPTTFVTGNFVVENGDDIVYACFAGGTSIDGPNGPVAVEELVEGDLVWTASGEARPVKWIGYRRLDLTRYANVRMAHPIRIFAGAFGEGLPRCDLVVSPDHAFMIDGKLIPARMLVNDMTIRRDSHCRHVTYYHIELETHDILLAEGLAAESYLDTGNRRMFENGDGPVELRPDFADMNEVERRVLGCCLPFATDEARVRPAWASLATRALALGYTAPDASATTDDPALVLMIDGRRTKPVSMADDRYVFVLPAGAQSLRLVSRSMVPADDKPWLDDRRRLGVQVRQMTLRRGNDVQTIAMDHPLLDQGWWAVERRQGTMGRWTMGDAAIGPFPGGLATLTVELAARAPAYPIEDAIPAIAAPAIRAAA